MAVTLQQIFQEHFDDFAARRPLADYQRKAGQRICDCRTPGMGGHLVSCPDGHVHRLKYHSCQHRSCPQCAAIERERWLAKWTERLLDTSHVHVIFTIPSELHPLWRYNKQTFAGLLFAGCTQSLSELLADDKYLGARPGMLAALHTWGQKLDMHPHLHVLVTFGGLTADGCWRSPKKDCLLPRAVLMHKFRGKFRALLLKALDAGQLVLPPDCSERKLRNLLNKLGRSVWNVKLLPRYAHGRGVITYLARYLKGGPIGNERITAVRGGRVYFSYRDHRAANETAARGPRKSTSLAVDEFLARILEHVPPPRMQTVRGYGLYANSKRAELAVAREHFGQTPIPAKVQVDWRQLCVQAGRPEQGYCPVCGKPLVVHGYFAPGRGPPACFEEREPARRVA